MNNKPIDKTKKSNIKCEHCKYWKPMGNKIYPYLTKMMTCCNTLSPQSGKERRYYNRCKYFEWKGESNED